MGIRFNSQQKNPFLTGSSGQGKPGLSNGNGTVANTPTPSPQQYAQQNKIQKPSLGGQLPIDQGKVNGRFSFLA